MTAVAIPGLARSDAAPAPALIGPCGFSVSELSFRGTPKAQAACLLRRPRYKGVIDARPIRLPKVLRERVGEAVQLDAGANFGLTKASPDLNLYTGITARF